MTESHSIAATTAPTSTMATAMLCGSIVFCTAALGARLWLVGDSRPLRNAWTNTRATPLDVSNLTSVYTLLFHLTVLAGILFFAYICEYHPPFPHAEKVYDRDEFFFLTVLLFIVSAYTIHKNEKAKPPSASSSSNKSIASKSSDTNANGHSSKSNNVVSFANGGSHHSATAGGASNGSSKSNQVAEVSAANEVLNRDQTEEWKGWMQFIFLLYHYYHAEEVYNSIRIMITCYVWMTGFGNFSFFYLKADYSAVRVMQMLWRLNFLVLCLCLSQGNTYILYYICPLHTYFFLMVYIVMRVGKQLNYSKYGIRLKLAVLAIIIFLLWDVDLGLFKLVHMPFLGTTPVQGATGGSMWEWYFRSTLDHWSTFLGIIFALNFPITSLFYRKLEAKPPLQQWLGKGIVAVALLAAFVSWVLGPFSQPKLKYNATNCYFGFIPLIAYIYLRNLTPTLRSYSLNLLHEIGKTTLETYLMQHHIWLTSDAKSLLTLIPGWPMCNMAIVTFIYVLVSRRLYRLTLFLRGMLLPDNRNFCYTSLASITLLVAIFYGLTLVMQFIGLLNLTSVGMISVVGGCLLYNFVIGSTVSSSSSSSASESPSTLQRSSSAGGSGESSVLESVMKGNTTANNGNESDGYGHSILNSSPLAKFTPLTVGALVVLLVGATWHGMATVGAGKIKPLPATCNSRLNTGAWVPVNGCNEAARGAAYREKGVSAFATCGAGGAGATFVWGWAASPSYTQCRFQQRDKKALTKTLQNRVIVYVGDSMTRNLYMANLRALGKSDAGQFNKNIDRHANFAEKFDSGTTLAFLWAPFPDDKTRVLQMLRTGDVEGLPEDAKPDLVVLGGGTWDQLWGWQALATAEGKQEQADKLKALADEMAQSSQMGVPVGWFSPTTIHDEALPVDNADKREHMTEADVEAMRQMYWDAGVYERADVVIDGPAFSATRADEAFDGVHYPLGVYDAGAQILAQSLDWVLPKAATPAKVPPPKEPGAMANPMLGLMMLCFVFIGLAFFDGFLGFSYLASLFVKGVMPNDLYEEAFSALHRKNKLPAIEMTAVSTSSSSSSVAASTASRRSVPRGDSGNDNASHVSGKSSAGGSVGSRSSLDEEIAALLGSVHSEAGGGGGGGGASTTSEHTASRK